MDSKKKKRKLGLLTVVLVLALAASVTVGALKDRPLPFLGSSISQLFHSLGRAVFPKIDSGIHYSLGRACAGKTIDAGYANEYVSCMRNRTPDCNEIFSKVADLCGREQWNCVIDSCDIADSEGFLDRLRESGYEVPD